MSFATGAATRRMAVLATSSRNITSAALRQQHASFTTRTAVYKSATDTVKDTVKDAAQAVNRKVSDTLVGGIDVGTNAAEKITNKDLTGKAKGTAEELKGEAMGKAKEMKGEAKGTAKEAAGKVNETMDSL